MFNKRLIFIGILALVITALSPFLFISYFDEKPDVLNQHLLFGGPFPFAEQKIDLPEDNNAYPIEVKFESPFEMDTNYKVTPFLLSFICFYLFLFALHSIISRFFSGRQGKELK